MQFSTQSQSCFGSARRHSLRLATTCLVSLSSAIVGVTVSEAIATQPQFSQWFYHSAAYAQGSDVQAAEAAVAFVETDRGRGSGVVVDPSGLIITNAHVVEGAREVSVTIQGRKRTAEVVSMGSSRCLDLALLKVEGVSNLNAIAIPETSNPRKAQTVYAIGYPGVLSGASATITQGIVSNIHPNEGMIQLDGSINPGNSGGAVVDADANLIGIATSGLTNADSINFAVSADKVQAFIAAYHQGASPIVGRSIMPGSSASNDLVSQALPLDGSVVRGVLQDGDNRYCQDSSLTDLYSFEAQAGQSILLNMSSQVIGSYLELIGPDGNRVAASAVRDRNQAAIVLENLPQTGTYTVVANAAQANQSGQYQLRATQPLLVENGAVHNNTAPCFEGGQRCQRYQFRGNASQVITLLLHQAEFDTYVMLLNPGGEIVSQGPITLQSAVNLDLAQEGWYTLIVGTQNPDDMGNFRVSVHDMQTLNPSAEVAQR